MRSDFIFATTLLVAVAFCSGAGAVNQHWSERSLRTAVQGGIHRALEEQIHLPAAIRSEIEDIIVDRLKDHLFREIAQIDGFVQGSFAIAQEFVNSAVQSSSRRTRWPNEQTIHYLEKEVAEADQKIAGLRPSFAGLMTWLDSNNAKMSSLNLEQIIADVVKELMKDEAFQHIVEWLGTLPGVIHGIADEFLANKTFSEIFQMLGARSEIQGMLVQGLVVQDVPAVDPVTGFKSAGKHTGSQSVMGLVGAGLKEAQSVLQLVAKTYRLIVDQQVKKLDKLVADLQEKMPYIPVEVMEYIHTSALRMIRFKPE
ncbi:hypothetical protein DAPPUDRAFT_310104 [Daphnia pulex]|uniref:Uncharacterized protein n=1 Tax=Daphnia pulex TaxID=6669 RepID=E9FSG0_DAPPU|nr:hypothetical protein DAPPUDRAFT_310104 [Daphnia pulex]|eukprot:EFX89839.1 hypothetical protein DAPPUDRAFT_310104 [Daphnia pulex]